MPRPGSAGGLKLVREEVRTPGRAGQAGQQKRQPKLPFLGRPGVAAGPRSRCARLLLEADAGELVAELLDAATQAVDALLRAGVERMGLAGGFQLEQRQLAAVFHVDRFLALSARARHELETVGQVHEADFAVVGVNAVFHGVLCLALAGRPVSSEATWAP